MDSRIPRNDFIRHLLGNLLFMATTFEYALVWRCPRHLCCIALPSLSLLHDCHAHAFPFLEICLVGVYSKFCVHKFWTLICDQMSLGRPRIDWRNHFG